MSIDRMSEAKKELKLAYDKEVHCFNMNRRTFDKLTENFEVKHITDVEDGVVGSAMFNGIKVMFIEEMEDDDIDMVYEHYDRLFNWRV